MRSADSRTDAITCSSCRSGLKWREKATLMPAFVRAGMGLTVLPQFAVHTEKERGEFAAVPLHDKRGPLSATLVLCTHRDRHLSAAARRVLSALNE